MQISTIISRAFRILLAQTSTPTTGENTRALEAFQSLITDFPGTIGARWIDVPREENYTAGEDERITDRLGTLTITLPTLCYLSGEGVATGVDYDSTTMRSPLDGARVQIVDQTANTAEMSFWRGDIGQWVSATGLTENDESPLPQEMDRYLPAMLAQELSTEYRVEIPPQAQVLAVQGWNRLRARYGARKAVAVDTALLTGSRQSFGLGSYNISTDI